LKKIDEPKTRPVLIMPVESVILEQIIGRNLVNHFRDNEPDIFFGKNSMKKLHGRVNADRDNYRLTLDWSRFDTTLPEFLLNDVFNMLRGFIDFQKMKCEGKIFDFTESKAAEYERIFDWV